MQLIKLNTMGIQTEIPCDIVTRGAILSPCEKYRYKLWRIWDITKPDVLFIMLNPSTADATKDDPTITRCINFAKSWGYGGLYVGNLCAFRTKKPEILHKAHFENFDVVGPRNNEYISEMARHASLIIYAWGAHGLTYSFQVAKLKHFIGNHVPHCLYILGSGLPGHPLYLPKNLTPKPF